MRTIATLCGILLVSVGTAQIQAQAQTRIQTQQSASVVDSAQLATITTDTGAFAPGPKDFSRYTAPGLCMVGSGESLMRSLEMQAAYDTIHDPNDPRLDTIGVRRAIKRVRACGSKFSLDAIKNPHEMQSLLELAVVARWDSLAHSALDRIMAQTPDSIKDSVRFKEYEDLRDLFPQTKFVGVDSVAGKTASPSFAQDLFTQIDSDGSWRERTALHHSLLNVAKKHNDMRTIQQTAEQLIAWLHDVPVKAGDTVMSNAVGISAYDAYEAIMKVAFYDHPDSMTAIAQRAKQEKWLKYVYPGIKADNFQQMSDSTVLDILSPLRTGRNAKYREKVPQFKSAFWFPKGADTIQPAPGKVTLVVAYGGSAYCSNACVAANVHSWLAQYGTQGLVVTYVGAIGDTADFYSVGYNQLMNGTLTESQAAERIRWIIQDYEKLPVTVALQTWHDIFVPAPDGRRVHVDEQKGIWNDGYSSLYGYSSLLREGHIALVGRDGTVLKEGVMNVYEFREDWDALIAWAIAQPPSITTAPQTKPVKP